MTTVPFQSIPWNSRLRMLQQYGLSAVSQQQSAFKDVPVLDLDITSLGGAQDAAFTWLRHSGLDLHSVRLIVIKAKSASQPRALSHTSDLAVHFPLQSNHDIECHWHRQDRLGFWASAPRCPFLIDMQTPIGWCNVSANAEYFLVIRFKNKIDGPALLAKLAQSL